MNTIEEDIAKSAHWHTIDDGAPWRDVCYRLAMEVERLQSENAQLRAGLSKVATNIGNGSFASPDASLDWLTNEVSDEVRLYCHRLRSIIASALPHVTAEKWHQITLENHAESEHIESIETAMKAAQ